VAVVVGVVVAVIGFGLCLLKVEGQEEASWVDRLY